MNFADRYDGNTIVVIKSLISGVLHDGGNVRLEQL